MTPEDLKAWRILMGLSQEDAAAATGLSTRSFVNWEGGQTIPAYVPLLCAAVYHKLEPWNEKPTYGR